VGAPLGVLLYLGSVGLVGAVMVGLFFGSGFVLLGQASEQMDNATGSDCSDTGFDLLRPSGPLASAENGIPFGEGVPLPSSAASGTAINGSVQTTAPDESARSSLAPSAPLFRGPGSNLPRKLSRPRHSRSGMMLGETRARSARSAKQDLGRDPEEDTADGANQQEYNQLHATGSAVNLAAEAPSR
jgi:hypothetical protein